MSHDRNAAGSATAGANGSATPSVAAAVDDSQHKGSYKPGGLFDLLNRLNAWLCYWVPPGPQCVPMYLVVNLTKGTMLLYLFALMCYFDNFSTGAWVYLALHGNYGLVWLLKDLNFPNPGFTRPATVISGLLVPQAVLAPYYFIGYWMMSAPPHDVEGMPSPQRSPSNERIFCAIQLYCVGVVLMVLTDAQQYLVLAERRRLTQNGAGGIVKKRLITDCLMGWSRNTNYLGEMMLYGAFGVLCQRVEVWCIYAVVWGVVFALRIAAKEYSLATKPGWLDYKRKTWLLLPKVYNSAPLSVVAYVVLLGVLGFAYINGGLETAAKRFGFA